MIIFNKMCKIVSIYFYSMLKTRKKTNNSRYIAQSYTLLYIVIIRLRLKNVYLFAWYFFRVKNDEKWILWKLGFYFCLRFGRHFFRHIKFQNFKILKKKISFSIYILRYHRKTCRLFPCILIFRGFFIKKCEKGVYMWLL